MRWAEMSVRQDEYAERQRSAAKWPISSLPSDNGKRRPTGANPACQVLLDFSALGLLADLSARQLPSVRLVVPGR